MKRTFCAVCLLAAAPLSHASAVRAAKLPLPKSVTCLALRQPITYTTKIGLFHLVWDVTLGRGAYVSEREDAQGTYYRAPPGALTQQHVNKKTHAPIGHAVGFVGGIYLPRNSATPPRLYSYYGSYGAAEEHPRSDADCSTLTYAIDPQTHSVNVWAMGLSTGIGTGIGMALGRSFQPHFQGSYGQAAGVGLIGGLLGGLIVGAIEKSKAGEIIPGPPLSSDAIEKIEVLAGEKVVMSERGHGAAPSLAVASPVTPAPPAIVQQASPTLAHADAAATTAFHAGVAAAAGVPANPATMAQARGVAHQLRCDAVTPRGTGYVASCGSYDVFIDCDTGQCRPTHTIKPND